MVSTAAHSYWGMQKHSKAHLFPVPMLLSTWKCCLSFSSPITSSCCPCLFQLCTRACMHYRSTQMLWSSRYVPCLVLDACSTTGNLMHMFLTFMELTGDQKRQRITISESSSSSDSIYYIGATKPISRHLRAVCNFCSNTLLWCDILRLHIRKLGFRYIWHLV